MSTGFAGGGRLQWSRTGEALRTFSLLAVALLLLHHLQYAFARMSPSEEAAAAHAHSYLSFVVVLAVLLFGFALAFFVRDLTRARSSGIQPQGADPPRLSWMWLQGSGLLLGSYVLQEAAESAFAHEHVQLTHMLFGQQGWFALVLAGLLGGVVALLRRGARAAIALVARGAWSSAPSRDPKASQPSSQSLPLPGLLLLGSIAGRAPPHLVFGL